MNHQDQIFCNPKEKYQRHTIKYFSVLDIRFFISHSKVKTDAECDNMIKANRENNELRVKKMDDQNHSCSCE